MAEPLVDRIVADAYRLEQYQPVSDSYKLMPCKQGAQKEQARQLAFELYNRLQEGNTIDEHSSDQTKIHAYILYSKLKSALKAAYDKQQFANSKEAIDLAKAQNNPHVYQESKYKDFSNAILHPSAMPVEIADEKQLEDFFNRLKQNTPAESQHTDSIGSYELFTRGAFYTDGRIDLCKQVVGPAYIGVLMRAIWKNPHVKHFLLGNNIIGDQGGREIAEFITHSNVKIETWYLAGNDLGPDSIIHIAQALSTDTSCLDLWLKRNPLTTLGVKYISLMLQVNNTIRTLDLDNVAMFDEGCKLLMDGLAINNSVKHLYMDSNGLTCVSGGYIADYFKKRSQTKTIGLTHLSVAINRLECQGAIWIVDALREIRYPIEFLCLSSNRIELPGLKSILRFAAESKTLQGLDIGYYKSTADMGELPNSFLDDGARHIAAFIMLETPLKYLGFTHTHISNLDAIIAALQFNKNLFQVKAEQYKVTCKRIYSICRRNSKMTVQQTKLFDRRVKHGSNLWVIDSIYRNKM